MNRTRYLIVKLSAVGDVAMASALPVAIRARDPEAHVTWLCGQRVADLVRLYDDVDEVFTVNEVALLRGGTSARITAVLALWATLLPTRFDVTLLGHADRRYRTLLRPLRTGRMRALDLASGPSMLPVPGRYFGDEYVRLLDEAPARGPIAGHWPLADVRPRLNAPARADELGVVLAPGGARNVLRESALKRWPVERYREVAAQLLEGGHRVTLVGDAGDTWVRPYFAGIPVRDEIGGHNLAGTLALLHQSELVIVHDTGILHLARLVRAPLLALFGPTNPAQFIAEAPDVTTLWGGPRLACRPCYDGREFAACSNNLCMQDIAVCDVVQHAERMLATGRRDQRLVRERS